MRCIEAPTEHDGVGRAVFLAGGIAGVEDWQGRVVAALDGLDVTVLNPRRADFDPTMTAQQLGWEHRHLQVADVTLFWFPACDPAVTVQPGALFMLGFALGRTQFIRPKPLIIGASPDYPRLTTVMEQARLTTRGEVPVWLSLDAAVQAARTMLLGEEIIPYG